MATLQDFRAKFPQYDDLTDQQLADGLYSRFYSDLDRGEFDRTIGFSQAPPDAQPTREPVPITTSTPARPAPGTNLTTRVENNETLVVEPRPLPPAVGPLGPIIEGIDAAVPNPIFSVVDAVMTGLQGISQIPSDVAGAVGFPGVAETLRDLTLLPNVDFRGEPADEIAADVLRFGLPAGAGAKAATTAAKAVPRLNTPVRRGIAGISGAAASDAAVTNPETDRSLLETVGAKDFSDRPLARRGAVAGEGAAAGAAVSPLVAATRTGAKIVNKGLEPFRQPFRERQVTTPLGERTVEEIRGRGNIISDHLVDTINLGQGVDAKNLRNLSPDEVDRLAGRSRTVANKIDDSLERTTRAPGELPRRGLDEEGTVQPEAFRPTTGKASNDPGLLAAEKSDFGSIPFASQTDTNKKALATERRILTDVEGAPGRTRDVLDQDFQAQRAAGQRQVDVATSQRDQAQAGLEATQDALREPARQGRGTRASAAASDEVEASKIEIREKRNRLFQRIDPKDRVRITDPTEVRKFSQAVSKATRPTARGDRTGQVVDREIGGALDEVMKFVDKFNRVPLKSLGALRNEISAALGKEDILKNGAVTNRLRDLRTEINRQIDAFAKGTHNTASQRDAAKRAQEALAFVADKEAPRFGKGTVGAGFKQRSRQGKVNPSQELGNFLKPKNPGAARNFFKISRDNNEASKQARDFILDDLGRSLPESSKPQAIDKWLERWGDTLDVPELKPIRDEIRQLRNRLKSGVSKTAQLDEDLKKITDQVSQDERARSKSVAGLFIDREPNKAISGIFQSANPERQMKALLSEAAKDKSGEAVKGVQRALADFLDDRIGNKGTADITSSLAKARTFVKTERNRKVLQAAFSEGEIKNWDKFVDRLEVASRELSTSAKSNTPGDLGMAAQRGRAIIVATFGIIRGNAISTIVKTVQKAFGADPVDLTKELLTRAMTDPELASRLIRHGATRLQERDKKFLRLYLENNVIPSLASADDSGED